MSNLYAQFTFDSELVVKDAGLIDSTEAGPILDIGDGMADCFLVIDLTACEIATGDEIYTISVEASNTADMSTGSSCVARKVFGNLVVPMDAALSDAGRYVVPFRNEEGGDLFRYVRVHTNVAGTVATGINYSAFIAKR